MSIPVDDWRTGKWTHIGDLSSKWNLLLPLLFKSRDYKVADYLSKEIIILHTFKSSESEKPDLLIRTEPQHHRLVVSIRSRDRDYRFDAAMYLEFCNWLERQLEKKLETTN